MSDAPVHRFDADLTIAHVAALKPALLQAVAAGDGPLVLDLGAVAELDTAGLQLLLLARREAAARGRVLQLRGVAPAVRDLLALSRVEHLLPDAPGDDA